MPKLDELIRELCPHGVEYKKIGKIANYEQPSKYIVESTDYNDAFDVPVLTAGQTFILGYTNESTGIFRASKLNPVIIFDDFTGAFKWVDFSFKVKSSAMKIITASNDVSIRYLFHVMGFLHYSSNEHKRLWIGIYSEFEVPVPPLEIQREIVRILDNYTEKIDELIQNLMTEITARKTQYNYYRDKLLKAETNAHKYKLGEIATVTKLAGFEFTNYVTYSENGNIIALRGLNVKNGRLDLHDVKYVDKSDFSKLERSKLHIGDMLFTYVGTVGQVAIVDEEDKYYLAPNVALIRCDKEVLLPQYMKYYFQTTQFWDKQIRRLLQSSSMQNIPMEKIRKFEIAVPPLDVQNRIVNVLDNFERICSDLNIGLPAEIEARQKQYEYYRDKLLTFAETGNTILSRAEQSRAEQSRAEQSRALIKLLQYVFGYAMLPLSEIANVFRGEYITKKNEKAGNIPVILGGQEPAYYIDRANHIGEIVAVARSGASAGFVSYWDEPIFITDGFGYEVKKEVAIPKYLYYVLKNKEIELNGMKRGAGVPHVSGERLGEINLPVPPIEEQKRIISILDRFDSICNDLTSGLPAEIKARQKQYEYYRDKLLTFKEVAAT